MYTLLTRKMLRPDAGGAGHTDTNTQDETTPETEQPAADAEADQAAGAEQQAAAETEKSFTQDDVNNIVTRESRKAVEKLLREAGIASDGDYKAALAQFATWQAQQQTELETAQGDKATLEQEKAEALKKAQELEYQLAVTKCGIPEDKAEAYTRLAVTYMTDGVEFAEALNQALEAFPLPVSQVPGAAGNPATNEGTKKTHTSGIQRF